MEDGDEGGKKDETASEPDRTPEGYKSRYFVSLVGRSQRRTLHRGGECHRVRGCATSGSTRTTGCARSASPEVSRLATSQRRQRGVILDFGFHGVPRLALFHPFSAPPKPNGSAVKGQARGWRSEVEVQSHWQAHEGSCKRSCVREVRSSEGCTQGRFLIGVDKGRNLDQWGTSMDAAS